MQMCVCVCEREKEGQTVAAVIMHVVTLESDIEKFSQPENETPE